MSCTDLANEDDVGGEGTAGATRDHLLHGAQGGADVGMHALGGEHAHHGGHDVATCRDVGHLQQDKVAEVTQSHTTVSQCQI